MLVTATSRGAGPAQLDVRAGAEVAFFVLNHVTYTRRVPRVVLLTLIATFVIWISAPQPAVAVGSLEVVEVARVEAPRHAAPLVVADDTRSPGRTAPMVVADEADSSRHAPWSPPLRCTFVATRFVVGIDPVVGVIDDVGYVAAHVCALSTVLSRGPPAP